jgi:phage host-nuclease inhibitor protein Gam
MARLYDLAGAYAGLQEAAEDGHDVGEALAQVNDAIEIKAKHIAAVLSNLSSDIATLTAEEKRLATRRRSIERNRERPRDYLRTNMDMAGIETIRCAAFSVTVCDAPERVEVEDVASVPLEFTRTSVEVNKAAILRAWKEGGECVPGTSIERGRRLLIK